MKHTILEMNYTKENGDKSSRSIIPTSKHNLLYAIDVSDLSSEERDELMALYSEYADYVAEQAKKNMKFEEWAKATHHKTVEPKWRTFRTDRMELMG